MSIKLGRKCEVAGLLSHMATGILSVYSWEVNVLRQTFILTWVQKLASA